VCYRDAYFPAFPGVWRHGDWMLVTERGSVVVSGRSDSTLNRHGVRLGSSDIYAIVDKLPQVSESLVIGAELGDGGRRPTGGHRPLTTAPQKHATTMSAVPSYPHDVFTDDDAVIGQIGDQAP
jgi:acyl-CoA synthetase (AMP-forming)/AMP-acid ligase II